MTEPITKATELRTENEKLIRWHREDEKALAEMRATIKRLRTEKRELGELAARRESELIHYRKATAAPPADRAALRTRVAEALMHWAEGNNNPKYAPMRRPETVQANAYSRADAVLAVLPAPADRAAEVEQLRAELTSSKAAHRAVWEKYQTRGQQVFDLQGENARIRFDRAAVLREAADALDASETLRDLTDDHMHDVHAAANELRRMADEEQS